MKKSHVRMLVGRKVTLNCDISNKGGCEFKAGEQAIVEGTFRGYVHLHGPADETPRRYIRKVPLAWVTPEPQKYKVALDRSGDDEPVFKGAMEFGGKQVRLWDRYGSEVFVDRRHVALRDAVLALLKRYRLEPGETIVLEVTAT